MNLFVYFLELIIDIRKAYFHAKARRDIYVALPQEDLAEGMCGKLNKAMYGTRDAAQNWEHEYSEFMETIGFMRGKASPCVFYNRHRELRVVIHGDDFTCLGNELELDMCCEYRCKYRNLPGLSFNWNLIPCTSTRTCQ